MVHAPLFLRRVRQLHLWLGGAIGIQIGLWFVSGLFMVATDIDKVRGSHLISVASEARLNEARHAISVGDALSMAEHDVMEVGLVTRQGRLIWLLEGAGERTLVGTAGDIVDPLTEAGAKIAARAAYTGRGEVQGATYYDSDTPREYGRSGPVYRVTFGPKDRASLYVDAVTGEVGAVRTPLWRVFDFMWGLHIMDWSSRENFNSWWLRAMSALAVLFFASGAAMVGMRVPAAVTRWRRSRKVIAQREKDR